MRKIIHKWKTFKTSPPGAHVLANHPKVRPCNVQRNCKENPRIAEKEKYHSVAMAKSKPRSQPD